MNKKISEIRKIVISAAGNPEFRHHKWFVRYHLEIVLQISLELCELHQEADQDLVEVLVWLHDYGKILDFDNDDEMLRIEGRKVLENQGFEEAFVEKTMQYLDLIEKKMEIDLHSAPIEVKIVSSANAASHLIGPFYYMWWYENPKKDYKELMEDNTRKAMKDWDRKIVLPEVKNAFRRRHRFLLAQAGDIPKKILVDN